MNIRTAAYFLLLAGSLSACTTFEGTFGSIKPDYSALPEDELRTVAAAIETHVASGSREPFVSPSASVAVDQDIVLQAIRARAARFELVSAFLDTGHAWERQDGTLWIIRSKEYAKEHSRRDKDREAMLVNGENGNRWTLYEELRKANGWPPSSLGAVQRIFHEARVQTMAPGQIYESADGERVAR